MRPRLYADVRSADYLLNGDLFKGVMAFSPGFVIEGPWVGKPRFYISHGKHDPILPIEKCGQDLVRARLAELD